MVQTGHEGRLADGGRAQHADDLEVALVVQQLEGVVGQEVQVLVQQLAALERPLTRWCSK